MQVLNSNQIIANIQQGEYTDIIFDFDETIVHLIIDWSQFHSYMKELANTYWVESERISMNTHAFVEFVIQKFWKEGKNSIDEICEIVESKYLSDIVVNEELVHFIQQNSKKYNFHILSNNMYSTITQALKKMNMWEYFIQVLGRDSISTPKPHPIWIEHIIKNQWWKKENFVMIGDNPDSDIAAASRAGIEGLVINMYI